MAEQEVPEVHWLCGSRKYDNVLGEGLESRSIWLLYSNGNMAGFSGLDIVHGAGFSCMCATDDLASSAVSYLICCIRSHVEKYSCPSPKLITVLNSHFDLLFFDLDPTKV
jgi:hypothetical protein